MLETTELSFQQVCREPFDAALSQHGDLGLTLETFASKIEQVVQAHPAHVSANPDPVGCLIDSLHTSDLYLSLSCAGGCDAAWTRFLHLYGKFISEVADSACSYQDWAGDVADSVLAGLFLAGPSGVSRIATYNGTALLQTWLRGVVLHRATDERRLRHTWFERLDALPESPATDPSDQLESEYRALTYGDKIVVAFQNACALLSEDDRYLLLMRYEEDLQISAIARLRGVTPGAITRRIKRICKDLKRDTIGCLRDTHNLPEQAIEECVKDVVDTPYYTIITALKGV